MGSPPPAEATPAPAPAPAPAPVVQVVRKFPAPCWNQDETLALIHAYQDKWFSLRRRNLRTADWEAVAEEVNRRCPNQSPPKTSAQCRHKMEKLRKRYRTEKQRISNLPFSTHAMQNNSRLGLGLFPASSWVFFDLMDAMEIGSAPGSTNTNTNPNPNNYYPKENFNHNGGVFVKEEDGEKLMMRGKEDLGKYFDDILLSVGKGPIKFKLNSHNHNTAAAPDNRFFDDDDDDDPIASNNNSADTRNFASASKLNHNINNNNNKRKMSSGGVGGFVNGCSFKRSSKRTPNSGSGSGSAVGDMVASISMLGDGLLKMETMKMELMQDLQRQRMQMDLHNTKLILDSQHSILTAFLHGFTKLKPPPPPPPPPFFPSFN